MNATDRLVIAAENIKWMITEQKMTCTDITVICKNMIYLIKRVQDNGTTINEEFYKEFKKQKQ